MKELTSKSVPAETYPVKVLQFGDGNFLRGFADWMIDVLNEKSNYNGSVVVVAPLRRGKAPVSDKQEGRYHVVFRGISEGKRVDEVRLVKCVKGYLDPYGAYEEFMATAALPSLQLIISNTTEAGISFNPGDTNADSPPDSFPAKVTQLLHRRFQTFGNDRTKGLTFLPCELIENNGAVLRNVVLQYAEYWKLSKGFTDWVTSACVFSNTLVDRIVTGYPTDYAQEIMQRTGYHDERLVAAEPYHLWVIEGDERLNEVFPVRGTGLNVKFVSDLTPYRTSKVRILNGAHTAMTLVGYLRGLRTVREAVQDKWMAEFIGRMVTDEVIPTIPLPADEVKAYATVVFERFHNPEIKHELKSIALNSVSKFRARLLPTLLDRFNTTHQLPPGLVQVFAALIVFYRGSWKGEQLPVNDHADVLQAFEKCWQSPDHPDIAGILSNSAIWGADLSSIAGLTDALSSTVQDLIS